MAEITPPGPGPRTPGNDLFGLDVPSIPLSCSIYPSGCDWHARYFEASSWSTFIGPRTISATSVDRCVTGTLETQNHTQDFLFAVQQQGLGSFHLHDWLLTTASHGQRASETGQHPILARINLHTQKFAYSSFQVQTHRQASIVHEHAKFQRAMYEVVAVVKTG